MRSTILPNPAAHTVIVPMGRREIPFGTFRSIVRQSGFKEQDFEQAS